MTGPPPDAGRGPGSPSPRQVHSGANQEHPEATARRPSRQQPRSLHAYAGEPPAKVAGRRYALNRDDIDAAVIAELALFKGELEPLLRRHGWRREHLAACFRVGRASPDHWLAGRRDPSLPHLVQIGRIVLGLQAIDDARLDEAEAGR